MTPELFKAKHRLTAASIRNNAVLTQHKTATSRNHYIYICFLAAKLYFLRLIKMLQPAGGMPQKRRHNYKRCVRKCSSCKSMKWEMTLHSLNILFPKKHLIIAIYFSPLRPIHPFIPTTSVLAFWTIGPTAFALQVDCAGDPGARKWKKL